MKTFKQFLAEEYVEKVDGLQDAVDIVNHFCKDWLENPVKIYRGMRNSGDAITVDPTAKKRVSKNTTNYYTIFFDHLLPESYPPRSYSLICTNDKGKAKHFGTPYAVIPFDGAKIGIVGAQDLWVKGVRLGNSRVVDIDILNARIAHALFDKGQSSWEDFVEEVNKHSRSLINNFEMEPEEFLDNIKAAYSEKAMGFKSCTTKDMGIIDSIGETELWIGSKCLLLTSDIYDMLRSELGLKA